MDQKRVYKIVLTGGPCGGKTTGQTRLCTFFENMGWKVFRVPETATVLLSGGIKFTDLNAEEEARKCWKNTKLTSKSACKYYPGGKTDCVNCCNRHVKRTSVQRGWKNPR